MNKELASQLTFTVDSIKKTKLGGTKLTLEIPPEFSEKAMALALYEETVFEADIFIVKP